MRFGPKTPEAAPGCVTSLRCYLHCGQKLSPLLQAGREYASPGFAALTNRLMETDLYMASWDPLEWATIMCEAVFWFGLRPFESISSYTSTAFSGLRTDAWLTYVGRCAKNMVKTAGRVVLGTRVLCCRSERNVA